MDLILLRDINGSRVRVGFAEAYALLPPGVVAQVVRPGETRWGREYSEWMAEMGAADPAAAEGGEYGYYEGDMPQPCTREELVARCIAVRATPWVWTPDSEAKVAPETVPFIVDAAAAAWRRKAANTVQVTALALAVSIISYAVLLPGVGFRSVLFLLPAVLAITLVGALHERHELRDGAEAAFPRARAWVEHAEWMAAQPAPFTRGLLWLLIAVFVAQVLAGGDRAISGAGLVKPAVRDEPWRLLTATLLHANFVHIWMNGAALLSVGKLLEAHSRREHLPVVFLVSGLAGSAASVLLSPDATSVGASGGILGVMGFLAVLGHRRRDTLPGGFARLIGVGIAATAALGAVGFAVIDNAAHFGGVVAGALLAWALDRWGVLDPGDAPRTRAAGYVAAVILIAGAAWAVVATMSGR